MILDKNKQKSEIRHSRLIFQKPPTDPKAESEKKPKQKPKQPEKSILKQGLNKLMNVFQDTFLKGPTKPEKAPEKVKTTNEAFQKNAATYYKTLLTTRNEITLKEYENELNSTKKNKEELNSRKPKTAEETKEIKKKLAETSVKLRRLNSKTQEIQTLREQYEAAEKEAIRIQKLAESDNVSKTELQGGYKWLNLGDELDKNGNIIESNLINQGKRYGKLSLAYLKLRQNSTGQDILIVRSALNNTSKIKYGLGAAHLLPPSIRTVSITTDTGSQTRVGQRMTINGRVGYYERMADGSYKYIPIFAGYSITPGVELKDATGKPIEPFIDETSEEYKSAVIAEARTYADAAQNIHRAEHNAPAVAEYLRSIGAKSDFPIANLKTLKTITDSEIEKALSYLSPTQKEEEIKRIKGAKQDLTRTEAMLDHFNIPLSSDSDANAGLQLISLQDKGGAAKMLGWDESTHTKMQKDWSKKLLNEDSLSKNTELTLTYGKITQVVKVTKKDKTYILTDKSTGKQIESINKWTTEKAASLLTKEPNPTVKLIQAMHNGGNVTIGTKDYEFSTSENYELNISHLQTLNLIAKNPTRMKKVCENLGTPIKPSEFISAIFEQGTMSLNEAKEYVENMGLTNLTNGNTTLDNLMNQSTSATTINPQTVDWNKYQTQTLLGNNQCANYVTSILGIGHRGSGLVSKLVSKLIRGGHRLVFGFENFKAGDVLAWTSYKEKLGRRTYSHTGIVRNTFTYNGQKYIAIQQEGKTIQINIVPVGNNRDVGNLRRNLRRKNREAFFEQLKLNGNSRAAVVLQDIYDYRSGENTSSIHVSSNTNWYGDYSKHQGDIAFAVRTNIAPPV